MTEALLDADAMIAEARAVTGLYDFGASPDVREPLSVLVDALNREARLSPAGREGRRLGLTRVLANRLKVEDQIARHPEILDELIRGPIVIVGLARSGTTKLHRMMAADPGLQSLPFWKMVSPVRGDAGDASLIRIAGEGVKVMRRDHPGFYAAHPMEATAPEEEVFLMEMSLMGNLHVHGNQAPSYKAWVDRQSFDPWYAYLRRVLQFFQWQDGSPAKPWLLKAPFHIGHLPHLLKHFPDAVVAHCHRDPQTVIASMGGLFEASRRMFSDDVSPEEVGRTTMEVWPPYISRYLQDRPGFEDRNRFIDLSYRRIISDAEGCIAEVYAAAGLQLSDDKRARMRAWEAENAQHKHGQHRYDLARYGITPAEVEHAFADYAESFGTYF